MGDDQRRGWSRVTVNLLWVVVALLFWCANLAVRLAFSLDVTNWPIWEATLVVGFVTAVFIGYNLALHRYSPHLFERRKKDGDV